MRIYELNLKRSRGAQNLYLTDVNLGLSNAQVVYSPKDKACETVTRELIKVMNNPDDTIYHVDDDIISDYIAKKVKDSGVLY